MTREKDAINRLIDAKEGYKEYLTDEAIDIAIEAIEQTGWIPVSERLPEKEMNCLVTDSLGKIHKVTFYYALDGREPYFSGCYCVRAWMPLPAPYEPQESEG